MPTIKIKNTTGKINRNPKGDKYQWEIMLDLLKQGEVSETRLGMEGIAQVSSVYNALKRKGYNVTVQEKKLSTNPFNPNKNTERYYKLEAK
ncbi:MAG TPA: hypothetical protein VLA13_05345 [Massilibacterium sp.]|nr:hypothetical protein [Massilibacterium sp.]